MARPNIISSALLSGLIEDDDSQARGWSSVQHRVNAMLAKTNHATTLFLGAAASSFKPTCFPAWDKFVELIYSSQIDQAAAGIGEDAIETCTALKSAIAQALRWDNARRVPNYKFTETIARRLGKDYLRILAAFHTKAHEDGWVVNHIHRWAAECLMSGSVAAIVTTNFDDCLEKALLGAGANTYLLTGDPNVDGAEVVARSRTSTRRLIIIVSGPSGCKFAQSLLPQVGRSISILYKLHGSCYMPDSCIDTRLQRQQGLPSYAVDILDYLLARSVFFVACFSGGDLNDNTDYLRMIHNRKSSRIVWLQQSNDLVEPGVTALSHALKTDDEATEGLCTLHGSMRGEQVRWNEEPYDFKNVVVDWCRGLGSPWCKLVVLDLIELCNGTTIQAPALERLGFIGSKRQDWNGVVEAELGETQGQQFRVASDCRKIFDLLSYVLGAELNAQQRTTVCEQLDRGRLTIGEWHQSAARNLTTHQPHAQAWVVSALYGLLLCCGNQWRAAAEALSFSQNAAYLVGDLESYEMVRDLQHALHITELANDGAQPPELSRRRSKDSETLIAFVPSLDGANGEANDYGVPRALFVRAIIHRAMLFADKIAINPNLFTNSSVFLREIAFRPTDELNKFYLQFLCPIIVHDNFEQDGIFQAMHQKSNSRKDYISEAIEENLMAHLDGYFSDGRGRDRFIPYAIEDAAANYLKWIRRAASEVQSSTKAHLMHCWKQKSTRSSARSAEIAQLDETLASDMIDAILDVVDQFTAHLNGPLTRSKLYNLGGLFVTILDDQDAMYSQLREDLDSTVRERLRSGRTKLLQRPWISGPLCHELFDVPYRCNPLFNLMATTEARAAIVFLEEHEEASLRFMAELASGQTTLKISVDTISIGPLSQISAILLGQASEHDLAEHRDAFAPIREKLAINAPIDSETTELFTKELGVFKRASIEVDASPITELAAMDDNTKALLLDFLSNCTFLVRKGEPLDRMYEEPQFTLPGVLRLERVQQGSQ